MIELLLTAIPLTEFDQRKLEAFIRKIPTAYVRTEVVNGMQKKFYSYPKTDDKGFKIECDADYYSSSRLPSKTSCKLKLLEQLDFRYEEHLIEIKDPVIVKNFYGAISYSAEIKKLHSNEEIYGLGLNGKYQKNFRYAFTCSKEKCQLTVSFDAAADTR